MLSEPATETAAQGSTRPIFEGPVGLQDITYPSLERSMQEAQNYLIDTKCRLLPRAAVCQRV